MLPNIYDKSRALAPHSPGNDRGNLAACGEGVFDSAGRRKAQAAMYSTGTNETPGLQGQRAGLNLESSFTGRNISI